MTDQSIHIPDLSGEFVFQASRSSGPGGQNVNKVNSRVELRFNIPASQLLDDGQKDLLMAQLSSKLTTDGTLIITSQKERSQLLNKEITIQRLYALLEKAFRPVKRRKATKPTKASVEKRISRKKKLSEKKKLRGGLDL